jgi:hypothetical protein
VGFRHRAPFVPNSTGGKRRACRMFGSIEPDASSEKSTYPSTVNTNGAQ